MLHHADNHWIRNPNADNAIHLPDNYYEMLAEGQSQEFVKVFCLGEYGMVGFGKKVYPEFNQDLHAMDYIEAAQGDPIHLGWDFGLTPACVVVQVVPIGRIHVLHEFTSEDLGLESFIKVVIQGLNSL